MKTGKIKSLLMTMAVMALAIMTSCGGGVKPEEVPASTASASPRPVAILRDHQLAAQRFNRAVYPCGRGYGRAGAGISLSGHVP